MSESPASVRSPGLIRKQQAIRQVEHSKLIAVRIEEARSERGMSVAELGRRSMIDRKRLWYILDGQRQMRADEFVRVCAVLNLGLRTFLTPAIADEMRRSRLGAGTLAGHTLAAACSTREEDPCAR